MRAAGDCDCDCDCDDGRDEYLELRDTDAPRVARLTVAVAVVAIPPAAASPLSALDSDARAHARRLRFAAADARESSPPPHTFIVEWLRAARSRQSLQSARWLAVRCPLRGAGIVN